MQYKMLERKNEVTPQWRTIQIFDNRKQIYRYRRHGRVQAQDSVHPQHRENGVRTVCNFAGTVTCAEHSQHLTLANAIHNLLNFSNRSWVLNVLGAVLEVATPIMKSKSEHL